MRYERAGDGGFVRTTDELLSSTTNSEPYSSRIVMGSGAKITRTTTTGITTKSPPAASSPEPTRGRGDG